MLKFMWIFIYFAVCMTSGSKVRRVYYKLLKFSDPNIYACEKLIDRGNNETCCISTAHLEGVGKSKDTEQIILKTYETFPNHDETQASNYNYNSLEDPENREHAMYLISTKDSISSNSTDSMKDEEILIALKPSKCLLKQLLEKLKPQSDINKAQLRTDSNTKEIYSPMKDIQNSDNDNDSDKKIIIRKKVSQQPTNAVEDLIVLPATTQIPKKHSNNSKNLNQTTDLNDLQIEEISAKNSNIDSPDTQMKSKIEVEHINITATVATDRKNLENFKIKPNIHTINNMRIDHYAGYTENNNLDINNSKSDGESIIIPKTVETDKKQSDTPKIVTKNTNWIDIFQYEQYLGKKKNNDSATQNKFNGDVGRIHNAKYDKPGHKHLHNSIHLTEIYEINNNQVKENFGKKKYNDSDTQSKSNIDAGSINRPTLVEADVKHLEEFKTPTETIKVENLHIKQYYDCTENNDSDKNSMKKLFVKKENNDSDTQNKSQSTIGRMDKTKTGGTDQKLTENFIIHSNTNKTDNLLIEKYFGSIANNNSDENTANRDKKLINLPTLSYKNENDSDGKYKSNKKEGYTSNAKHVTSNQTHLHKNKSSTQTKENGKLQNGRETSARDTHVSFTKNIPNERFESNKGSKISKNLVQSKQAESDKNLPTFPVNVSLYATSPTQSFNDASDTKVETSDFFLQRHENTSYTESLKTKHITENKVQELNNTRLKDFPRYETLPIRKVPFLPEDYHDGKGKYNNGINLTVVINQPTYNFNDTLNNKKATTAANALDYTPKTFVPFNINVTNLKNEIFLNESVQTYNDENNSKTKDVPVLQVTVITAKNRTVLPLTPNKNDDINVTYGRQSTQDLGCRNNDFTVSSSSINGFVGSNKYHQYFPKDISPSKASNSYNVKQTYVNKTLILVNQKRGSSDDLSVSDTSQNEPSVNVNNQIISTQKNGFIEDTKNASSKISSFTFHKFIVNKFETSNISDNKSRVFQTDILGNKTYLKTTPYEHGLLKGDNKKTLTDIPSSSSSIEFKDLNMLSTSLKNVTYIRMHINVTDQVEHIFEKNQSTRFNKFSMRDVFEPNDLDISTVTNNEGVNYSNCNNNDIKLKQLNIVDIQYGGSNTLRKGFNSRTNFQNSSCPPTRLQNDTFLNNIMQRSKIAETSLANKINELNFSQTDSTHRIEMISSTTSKPCIFVQTDLPKEKINTFTKLIAVNRSLSLDTAFMDSNDAQRISESTLPLRNNIVLVSSTGHPPTERPQTLIIIGISNRISEKNMTAIDERLELLHVNTSEHENVSLVFGENTDLRGIYRNFSSYQKNITLPTFPVHQTSGTNRKNVSAEPDSIKNYKIGVNSKMNLFAKSTIHPTVITATPSLVITNDTFRFEHDYEIKDECLELEYKTNNNTEITSNHPLTEILKYTKFQLVIPSETVNKLEQKYSSNFKSIPVLTLVDTVNQENDSGDSSIRNFHETSIFVISTQKPNIVENKDFATCVKRNDLKFNITVNRPGMKTDYNGLHAESESTLQLHEHILQGSPIKNDNRKNVDSLYSKDEGITNIPQYKDAQNTIQTLFVDLSHKNKTPTQRINETPTLSTDVKTDVTKLSNFYEKQNLFTFSLSSLPIKKLASNVVSNNSSDNITNNVIMRLLNRNYPLIANIIQPDLNLNNATCSVNNNSELIASYLTKNTSEALKLISKQTARNLSSNPVLRKDMRQPNMTKFPFNFNDGNNSVSKLNSIKGLQNTIINNSQSIRKIHEQFIFRNKTNLVVNTNHNCNLPTKRLATSSQSNKTRLGSNSAVGQNRESIKTKIYLSENKVNQPDKNFLNHQIEHQSLRVSPTVCPSDCYPQTPVPKGSVNFGETDLINKWLYSTPVKRPNPRQTYKKRMNKRIRKNKIIKKCPELYYENKGNWFFGYNEI